LEAGMDKKVIFKKIVYAIIFISAFLGIIVHNSTADNPFHKYAYFTLQSNLLVAILYFTLLFKKTKNRAFYLFENQVALAIILTGLVFNLMLKPYINIEEYNPNGFSDFLVHTLTPLLVIFERIFVSETNKIKLIDPIFWLIFPFFYWIFSIVFVLFGGDYNTETTQSNYPYFFLDFKEWGIWYFLLVLVFIVGIGYLLYFIDRLRIAIIENKALKMKEE
jgi:hypothetical protein